MSARLDEVKKKIAVAQEKIKKICQETFNKVSREIFDKYPKLESFGWNQYTPYFMDGDPCEFGVNTSDLNINGINRYEHENLDDCLKKASNEIIDLLSVLDEDFFYSEWGDHVEITVHRDGHIEVEEYSHD